MLTPMERLKEIAANIWKNKGVYKPKDYRAMSYEELRPLTHEGDTEAMRERLIRDYQAELDHAEDIETDTDEEIRNSSTMGSARCREGLNALLNGDDPEKWNY